MTDLDIEVFENQPRMLGRNKVHDPRSRAFPTASQIDPSKWVTRKIRVHDPYFNPNQCHGECTGCANAMMLNTQRNRVQNTVLGMDYAHKVYSRASQIDPWPGSWPPVDQGSSGLAAAKAAQEFGTGGVYRHVFTGANGVAQLISEGRTVSVGTWWNEGLFTPNQHGVVEPTGPRVGGHQYLARGYNADRDLILIRCWWGTYRDVWIKREHLNDLIMQGGDAHIQDRKL